MAKTAKPAKRAMALGETALTVLPANAHEDVVIARGFKVSVSGLNIQGAPSMELCEKVGLMLRVIERGSQFALGDFINYVEERFGEEAAQVIDHESGWSDKTVSVYRWLASRIEKPRRRMDRLGVRHHLLVAPLTASLQAKWLTKAANDDGDAPWTVQKLADELAGNEETAAQAWWVLVLTDSAQEQQQLMESLEQQGRTVKALVKRKKTK